MKRLGIIVDAITALRTLGGQNLPDPVHAIAMIEMAGADSIVYTLQGIASSKEPRDVKILKDCIHTHFNLRITPNHEMVQLAINARAEMVTLIRMEANEIKSIAVQQNENQLMSLISDLRAGGIVVNVLIEPDANEIKSAVKIGCDYIELNTEKYVNSDSLTLMEQELENLKAMAMAATKLDLGVMASGHLNYTNVRDLLKIDEIEEINVGHSVVSRALFVGLDQAVRDFVTIVK
ncbi:pyridoxine 5'-phosphate synthase [bacterium]|nr:pyridoxine 5'-phosphate synthase [bacterium]